MTKQQLARLGPGDIVQSRLTGIAYTVLANYGDHAIAVAIAQVSHADEWDLLCTAILKQMPTSAARKLEDTS